MEGTNQQWHDDRTCRGRVTRRQFLRRTGMLVAAGVLAGCGVEELEPPSRAPFIAPAEVVTVPSPQIPGPPPAVPTVGPGELGLEQFLQLSSLLTGFDNLDPVLGRVYLDSLQTEADQPKTPRELFEVAGLAAASPPQDVDDLGTAGFFDDDGTRKLADTIIEYWYTGIYQKDGKQMVATYVDALVWDAMDFTKPRTICGPFASFWEEQPPALP